MYSKIIVGTASVQSPETWTGITNNDSLWKNWKKTDLLHILVTINRNQKKRCPILEFQHQYLFYLKIPLRRLLNVVHLESMQSRPFPHSVFKMQDAPAVLQGQVQVASAARVEPRTARTTMSTSKNTIDIGYDNFHFPHRLLYHFLNFTRTLVNNGRG